VLDRRIRNGLQLGLRPLFADSVDVAIGFHCCDDTSNVASYRCHPRDVSSWPPVRPRSARIGSCSPRRSVGPSRPATSDSGRPDDQWPFPLEHHLHVEAIRSRLDCGDANVVHRGMLRAAIPATRPGATLTAAFARPPGTPAPEFPDLPAARNRVCPQDRRGSASRLRITATFFAVPKASGDDLLTDPRLSGAWRLLAAALSKASGSKGTPIQVSIASFSSLSRRRGWR